MTKVRPDELSTPVLLMADRLVAGFCLTLPVLSATMGDMPRFTIRLDDMTAAYFDAFAEQFGGRSQAMRALVEQALTASRATQSSVPAEAGKQRLEVRLDYEDMARLNNAAKMRHCKSTWWASRLIRAQLRGETIEPPLDLEAVLAGLLLKADQPPQVTPQSELEAAGQMRLLD